MRMTSQSVVQIDPIVVTDDRDDESLVRRARRGDRIAFARLVEERSLRLLRTATVILGNEADAFEAAQEALLAAWINLPGLRDPHRFDAWLNRTLVNKCRDAARKRRRVREIALDSQEIAVGDASGERAEQAAILAAFDRLAVEQRQLLVMHHIDRMSIEEVAHQLGIPAGTAKSRLWSARKALERALEAES